MFRLYYEWLDEEIDIYRAIYKLESDGGFDRDSCWFCLDGLKQKELARRRIGTFYTLLATSEHVDSSCGDGSFEQVVCLLPYWRQGDLEDLAKKSGMSYAVDRYFVSSGSVRFFVSPIGKAKGKLHTALRKINTEAARTLLTPTGTGSDSQLKFAKPIADQTVLAVQYAHQSQDA
ncbi:hypothetical protein ON010_g4746 [Phytophthora cinnamomi]|nr:hypothetical protein ON010_g4746 [Phytophthora cinnamomi]